MDIKTFCKRFMIWTAVITAVILLVLGLCFGRVIEANIWEEIGKWFVLGIGIVIAMEVFAYTLSQFFYHGSKYDPTSIKYRQAKDEYLPVGYLVFENDLKIYNSYDVPKYLFREALATIQQQTPDIDLWKLRSMVSIRREWATHNLLYALNIMRDRTIDVDLNFEHKWYMKLAYFVTGSIAVLFIK